MCSSLLVASLRCHTSLPSFSAGLRPYPQSDSAVSLAVYLPPIHHPQKFVGLTQLGQNGFHQTSGCPHPNNRFHFSSIHTLLSQVHPACVVMSGFKVKIKVTVGPTWYVINSKKFDGPGAKMLIQGPFVLANLYVFLHVAMHKANRGAVALG